MHYLINNKAVRYINIIFILHGVHEDSEYCRRFLKIHGIDTEQDLK